MQIVLLHVTDSQPVLLSAPLSPIECEDFEIGICQESVWHFRVGPRSLKRHTDSDRLFNQGWANGFALQTEKTCTGSDSCSGAAMDNDTCDRDDDEIVRQVVVGDVDAFEHLVKRYKHLVLGIVKKHVPFDEVEDTVQDVFVRIYRSLSTFRGKSSFGHWLSVIAVRTCYDFWREHYKSRELAMSSLTEQHQAWLDAAMADNSSQSFREAGLQKEAREILDWALDRLSAEDRMVLELVYLEGRSVKEAADLLGWSTANVKVRLFRSRRKLLSLLTGVTKQGRGDA
jgi:RNA polymerase sigma-70 factor (ECF subfamily)